MKMTWTIRFVAILVCTATSVLLSGCATTKVDWDSRIGKATFDEIVTEMGPPDKQATLKDGATVAEWVTRKGSSYTTVNGYYPVVSPRSRGVYYPVSPTYVETTSPDYLMRLTFDGSGKLAAWKSVRR